MSQFKQPKFQTSQHESRFKQRDFNGDNRSLSATYKPHFAQGRDKPNPNEKNNRRAIQGCGLETKVSEVNLASANGHGQVKVIVKSTGISDKPKTKKTGALSPRAPEKIKKNRSEEMKVYGESACLALFTARPESIVRVWTTVEMSHKVGDLFSYLAANKKVYHVVDREELELVSGAEHHGGICMLVKKQRPLTLTGYLDIPHKVDCLVLLDGVRNAQNVGGIIRTCAFYGVKNIVVENAEQLYSPMSMRTAEGGAEFVRLLNTTSIEQALAQLRKEGYQIVHINQTPQGTLLKDTQFNAKVVLVLNEGHSQALFEQGDTLVSLSSRRVLKNGLNVAVNAGVLLAHWYANA